MITPAAWLTSQAYLHHRLIPRTCGLHFWIVSAVSIMVLYLYHLVRKATWEACKRDNSAYYPPTYEADGFIHLTKEPRLLLPVANHFYKDDPESYILLQLDSERLTAEVKFEAPAPVGDKQPSGSVTLGSVLYPHLYGTIDHQAVYKELEVERAPDGTFVDIAGLPKA